MEFNDVKIEIYIPEEYLPQLREALRKGNAGVIGNYDSCMSIVNVRGYWRPLEGADPFDGEVGNLCEGQEVQVEVRCSREHMKMAVEEIRNIHPYEEPVINVIPLITI